MFRRYFSVFAKEETPEQSTDSQKTEETAWQRVTALWKRVSVGEDDYGDANIIRSTFLWGGICGFTYGTLFRSHDMVKDFIRKHNDYTFLGEYEARRRLTDYVVLQTLRNGAKLSWRVSLFSGSIMFLLVSAVTYRNDFYVTDFVATSALVGGLWKVKFGLKGTVSGATVAGTFGLICGCMVKLILLATNTTVPELRARMNNDYLFYMQRERVRKHKKLVEDNDKENFKYLLENQEKLEKMKENAIWTDSFFDETNTA